MPEAFFSLSPADRLEALRVAASASGRPLHILEKDTWVVWSLSTLFQSPFGEHLVFKGGTSLSKVYKAIQRFSEDIDVTYDIRAIAPDLVRDGDDNPLPQTKSQGRKWTDTIRERVPIWLDEKVLPHIQQSLAAARLEATARREEDSLFIDYAAQTEGYGYVAPRIQIEFGARSTGEPADTRQVSCDAAEFLPTVSLPTALPRMMRVERTIWEKMTATHVLCLKGDIRDRLSRHWYDVAKLDAAGYVNGALEDRELARRVAEHKSWFFAANDSHGQRIDYAAAVNGHLVLVPQGATLKGLKADYQKMVADRLFLGAPETFDWIIARCKDIEAKANARPSTAR